MQWQRPEHREERASQILWAAGSHNALTNPSPNIKESISALRFNLLLCKALIVGVRAS